MRKAIKGAITSKYFTKIFLSSLGIPLQILLNTGTIPEEPTTAESVLLSSASFTVMLYSGYSYFKSAYYTLRNLCSSLDLDMSFLVSFSCMTAWVYSTLIIFDLLPDEEPQLYFAAPLITLFTLNNSAALKDLGYAKVNKEIRDIRIDFRHRLQHQEQKINKGDTISVKQDSYLPVDGLLESKSALLGDMDFMTGSANQKIQKGMLAFAGAKNRTGAEIKIQATCNSGESRLDKLQHDILFPNNNKKIFLTTLTDKAAKFFVPLVLAASIITYLLERFVFDQPDNALHDAMNVSFAACPCVIALAMPLAITIMRSLAFKETILIRNESAIDTLLKATMFVFDNNGTLTEPEVFKIHPVNEYPNHLLSYAASLEHALGEEKHPYARAIMQEAARQNLTIHDASLTEAKEYRSGISGSVNGDKVLIGSKDFLIQNNIFIPYQQENTSASDFVYVSINQQYSGTISFSEKIRNGSHQVIDFLKKRNADIKILSGASHTAVEQTAKQLGIADFAAEKNPNEKKDIIAKLKNQGRVVMIADGENDILSTNTADVSICVTPCAPLASQADFSISSNLDDIILLFDWSAKTMRNVKQGIAWGIGYNVLAILFNGVIAPLLAIRINPAIAGAAMGTSSLITVLNALRLFSQLRPLKNTNKRQKKASLDTRLLIYSDNEVETKGQTNIKSTCTLL